MREGYIQIRFARRLNLFNDGQPVRLHPRRKVRPVVQKSAQSVRIGSSGVWRCRIEQQLWIEAANPLEIGPNVLIHRREASGIRSALERFEIELSHVHAVPVESTDQGRKFFLNGSPA